MIFQPYYSLREIAQKNLANRNSARLTYEIGSKPLQQANFQEIAALPRVEL
jgi:hypothetical protein